METPIKINPKRPHTQFYHEISSALIGSKFGALEFKVMLAILRKTVGYQKEYAEISLRYFEKMIKTNHWNIAKVLDRLYENEIIIRQKGPTIKNRKTVHKYAINEASLHRWNTRGGLSNTHKNNVSGTPIKERKQILKKEVKSLGDKMTMN